MASTRDTKMYPVCDPWNGAMGPPFERVFKPNFLAGLRKRWDDYSSLYRHLHGQDPGGMAPSTAAQLAVNANHLNATNAHPGGNAAARQKSAVRFEARNDEASLPVLSSARD